MRIKASMNITQIKAFSYGGAVLIFGLSLFFSWSFLYSNFYLVMTQSSEIMNMQKSVPLESLDIEKFDDIIKKIDDKSVNKENVVSNLNNPFK